jgi:hypothetical protein
VFSQTNPPLDLEFGDPTVAKRPRRPRWTIGRVANDLAIVMIVVPIGLNLLEPQVRGSGSCGNTLDNFVMVLGLFFFAAKGLWIVLKALNDAAERGLTTMTKRLDVFASAEPARRSRKPKTLDEP